jgi:hypothetical protein
MGRGSTFGRSVKRREMSPESPPTYAVVSVGPWWVQSDGRTYVSMNSLQSGLNPGAPALQSDALTTKEKVIAPKTKRITKSDRESHKLNNEGRS